MNPLNNLAAGFLFSGFFGSILFGINVMATPWNLTAAAVDSLRPIAWGNDTVHLPGPEGDSLALMVAASTSDDSRPSSSRFASNPTV